MAVGQYQHLVTLDTPTGGPLDPAEWWCGYADEGAGQAALFGPFHPGITVATRVHFKNRVLHVVSIDNPQERDRSLVLHCREVYDSEEAPS